MTTTTTDGDALESVLNAALGLMEARALHTVTVTDWVELARAIAKAKGEKWQTRDFLSERDLDDVAEYLGTDWDEATDGPLPPAED